MKAKKRIEKRQIQPREEAIIKTGRGLSYILECRYCSRKVPVNLHARILGELKEAQSIEGKRRFLVCKDCFPRYARERRK